MFLHISSDFVNMSLPLILWGTFLMAYVPMILLLSLKYDFKQWCILVILFIFAALWCYLLLSVIIVFLF